MRSSDLVVADTSPILNLVFIDRAHLLDAQFESITVPTAVRDELLAGEDGVDELASLLEDEFVTVTSVDRTDLVLELRAELDAGEAEAIALAVERDADLVLIDEREGRKAARRHGLKITGVVGLLIRGARDDVVDVRQSLDELRENGFWIGDDLYQRAVAAVESETN